MGVVVAGGAEGLTREHYARAGIEDYTEQFNNAGPATTDAFGELLNQEESLERFVESLALDVRGRLNLGKAGVGKTTCVQAFFSALEKLDRGEAVTGPYAEQIVAYHKQLHDRPRGEIIALWNPKDYNKPIFFRARDANATTSLEDALQSRNDQLIEEMHQEAAAIIRHALLHQQALESLCGSYSTRERLRGDTQRLYWNAPHATGTKLRVSYRRNTPQRLRNYWNRTVRSTALDLSKSNPRPEVDQTIREILALGKEAMENEKPHLKRIRTTAEQQLNRHVVAWLDALEHESDVWKDREPDIAAWYKSAAEFLHDERHRESLLNSLWEEGEQNSSSVSKGRSSTKDLDDDEITVMVTDKVYALNALLTPSRKREPAGNKLIIRSPTIQDPMDLFMDPHGYLIEEDEPLHAQVALGELAYADIVFIDDGIADLMAMKDLRQALLTYLSEGRINVVQGKTQIECKTNCHLFACETVDPFRRQIYDGTEPEHDDGMERRFAIVRWSSLTDHGPSTVTSFPTLIERTTRDVRSVDGDGLLFEPEALNLLYHHLLTWSEPSLLFPLAIGQLSKEIFQPLAARVGGQGKRSVSADDVRKFFDSRRSDIKRLELYLLKHNLAQHPIPTVDRLVGHVNKLYAGEDFGGVCHLAAAVGDTLEPIKSADKEAGLVDETYRKGVEMTDAWVHRNFGPLRLSVKISANTFDAIAGASSSAVNTYATLSALGDIPLDQNMYITGTVLDLDGHVGVIGGVFEKTRGALQYHLCRFAGREIPPMRVLIPENNAREFLRQTMLDNQVAAALRDGSLEVRTHADLWDGFSEVSGLSRNEWEPRVRERVEQLTERIAQFENKIKNSSPRQRSGRRNWR